MDIPPALPATIAWTRGAAVAGTLVLIALCLVWELWLAPTGQRTLAIKALPLVFTVPGLLRMRLYTYRWMSLLVWLYVAEGLVRASSDRGSSAWLAALEVALSLLVFAACGMHVRMRLRNAVAAS
ncbi:MAG: DUF2069 domain-containing protein [Pseudomonadota bacterium]|nr:DUF2069 domain-containing protein [Pseudomonadota bacterium]